MREKLTWLHISDIHFNPKTEWRDSGCRSTLLDHLKAIFKSDNSLRPDFIFCTGDIAFGEASNMPLSKQYDQAKIFLDDLLTACGQADVPLSKERLFIVPGNHDVNRNKVNKDAQSTLTSWAKNSNDHIEKINQRVDEKSPEFLDAIKRLDEYAQFIKEYLPHQQDSDERHHYANVIDVDGLKVGVAGFNSAWTCAGLEDDRNIWLAASWQFNIAQEKLDGTDIRIGLMHHPIDWLNQADRSIATRRVASDFDFWLHGHNHDAWVSPGQSHITVAAGAVGAVDSDEFGINLSSIDLSCMEGRVHLYNKKSGSKGWTISPVYQHAPAGQWPFTLPTRLQEIFRPIPQPTSKQDGSILGNQDKSDRDSSVDRYLTNKLKVALQSFSLQLNVWADPIISRESEADRNANSGPKVDLSEIINDPKSAIIKAPPQYGQTCLAHFLAREAWRTKEKSLWLYLDSNVLKPHAASINKAIADELTGLGCSEQEIKCVILDSWSDQENESIKLLKNLNDRFKDIPIICMQHIESGLFGKLQGNDVGRQFEVFYLWSLPRKEIRKIVAAFNAIRAIGDEDAMTKRIISDLEVLNLHRTALNCLTLLLVSEINFEEKPINRSEVIKKMLSLLFNVEDIPSYKTRPDLKDCEYVLGYFCELLIKDGAFSFSRDKFLYETQKFCKERLIDLETHVVFDVLYNNNILVNRANFFSFKFSYWIFYFVAQRMHHEKYFADYIFDQMRYAQQPEIIEFYTGIDRLREDALHILIRDIHTCCESMEAKCGLPKGLNPYRHGRWEPSEKARMAMEKEITDGVLESNLPAAIKDQYADRSYDPARPHDQNVSGILVEHSYIQMVNVMKSGARALRNSDYASPIIKRQLLKEILNCWEMVSKVLLIILPPLAESGYAQYDGSRFRLLGNFGETIEERAVKILQVIPVNVVMWFQEDIFSKKMGPLFFSELDGNDISDISRHELILLLIQQRPRDWNMYVHRYISSNARDSFYLFDIQAALRSELQYGFASPKTLQELEFLIKMTATKHLTGEKEPKEKSFKKVKFGDGLIPPREGESPQDAF